MNEFKRLRWFVVKQFVIIIAVAGVIEATLVGVLNSFITPIVVESLLPDEIKDISLEVSDLFIIFGIVIAYFILALFRIILPGVVDRISYYLEGYLSSAILGSDSAKNLRQIISDNYVDIILFILYIIATLIVISVPIITASLVYAWIITKEFQAIEKQRDEEKEKLEKDRNLLLSDIAHDLRTPITTILGYSTALSDGAVPEEKKKEYIDSVAIKSQKLSELIDLLFEYVKLDSEGFKLDLIQLDLAELLREVVASAFSDIEEAGDNIEINIPDKSIFVYADKLQLSRVILNIITNAIKHNDSGIDIGVFLIEYTMGYKLIIADSGDKIDESKLESVFDPFVKGDESRSDRGSGLGLSIVKKIVLMHEWDIKIIQDSFEEIKLISIDTFEMIEKYTKAFVIDIV